MKKVWLMFVVGWPTNKIGRHERTLDKEIFPYLLPVMPNES